MATKANSKGKELKSMGKLVRIGWKDQFGVWSGLAISGDETVGRIIATGGKVLFIEEAGA
jgi:hypothetical protein